MTTGILQHRRNDTATLSGATPAAGEIFLNTDTNKPVFGDGITAGGFQVDGAVSNHQVGTTYTVLQSDCGKLVTFTNASPVAVTLGTPSSSFFPNQSKFNVLNLGFGVVTITPTASTINGLSSLILPQYCGALIWSDGTNYFCIVGYLSGVGVSSITTKTADYTIQIEDSGMIFDNIGASVDIVLTLPTAARGLNYSVTVFANHFIKLLAGGADVISIGTDSSALGGYVRSTSAYSSISIRAHGSGLWIVSAMEGVWGIDT